MAILQQSSKAQDRSLGQWYVQIVAGTLKLPRFQRFEAWDRGRVCGFLDTIVQNLPVGVTLILQVGDEEKFVSRYIVTAPGTNARVSEHLLDGQQRLTAFWRAMHNNYEGETYFVYLPEFDTHADDGLHYEDMTVHWEGRWTKKKEPGKRYPVWVDIPAKCLQKGLFPIDLLCPGDQAARIERWIGDATNELEPDETAPDALAKYKQLEALRRELRKSITELRERVTHFNLPFLALPPSTEADVALQVFINMNTNSKPLSMYDLTVAKVEDAAGVSLHEMQETFEKSHLNVTHFGDVSSPILLTAAMLQGFMPNQGGIAASDKGKLVSDWNRIVGALARAYDFLERQQIFDEFRLPSNVVVPVLAACFDKLPETGDELGRAEQLLQAYLWSAFFTTRYEGAAATRSFQDFKALLQLLERRAFATADYESIPIMKRDEHPLPSVEQLTRAGWPKGTDRLARAILAVNTHFGAWDFADGKPASFDSLRKREYHHVFPDALLSEAGIESYLSLNCALLTWKTNRSIGRKDPLEYLQDRVEWADEETVKQRLRTHLLEYGQLSTATYCQNGKPLSGSALQERLSRDFEQFLADRAELVSIVMEFLVAGRRITLDGVMEEKARRKSK